MCLAAVNAFTTNAWLGQSVTAETTALSAHRTLSPSCLTLFWQPPSISSTFPSTSTRPLPIHSTLSVSMTTCHATLPFSPLCCVLISNSWMTVGWSGLPPTNLPKALLLIGFFNGSVAPASRPRPCRTSLLCPQSRVLSVPPLLQSCLTGPLDALCFCVSCQLVVPHDGVSPPPQPPVPPAPALPPDNDLPPDWFSHVLPTSRFWHSVLALLSFDFMGLLSRNRVWSLPIPLVTGSRFLLSNLSSGLPTHSPSSVHTPITSTLWTVANLQLHSCSHGLCRTGGCHPF